MAAHPAAQLPNYRKVHASSEYVPKIKQTKWLFVSICFYLASQAYQIPLLPIGPSWAIWPTLSDISIGMMVLAALFEFKHLKIASQANKMLLRILVFVFAATVVAFLVSNLRTALMGIGERERSAAFGIYQIFRMTQFLIVFALTAALPLDTRRLKIIQRTTVAALIMIFIGLVATYTSLVPSKLLAPFIPPDKLVSGPWAAYTNQQMYESGTISYNHSYVAVQFVLLAGFALALQRRVRLSIEAAYLAMGTIGCFISGSRAGMAAMLFVLVAHFFKRPAILIMALLIAFVGYGAFGGFDAEWQFDLGETAQRQLTLSDPLNPNNLSGRAQIWRDNVAFLNEDPVRWLIGEGTGSTSELEYNAHNLYLQLVLETGIIGLFIFCYLFYMIFKFLNRAQRWGGPMKWTTVALLLSALTQETLYPVPSMGQFLGLYFCTIAIVINLGSFSRLVQAPVERSKRCA